MVTLHYNGTTLQVQEDDSSFRYKAIMGDNSVTLKFSLNEAIDFPVGTYIMFDSVRYTLTSPEKWNRHGSENIEYTMVLEGVQSSLKKYKLRNQQDGRLKFSMNASPAEFLQLIIDNLNQAGRESGWSGTCNISAENRTIEFNHDFVASALTAVATAFETEYEITDSKVIRLGKVEYNKANPLPLAYGKGNGFKPGTGRANSNDSRPIEILYVQGGERNIDRSLYGSKELHLPRGGRLTFEGVEYQADSQGLFIQRYGVTPRFGNEDSFDGSEIYPKRVGTVSEVIEVNAEKHLYDFTDLSIPATLDYNQYIIAGETMTVIFQTGMLAGKEFEISKYVHEVDGVEERRFEIVPLDIDGISMPGGSWLPTFGDKYAIFGCTLPPEYIADDEHKTGAEWDLFREAARCLHDNEDFKFTFTGELQGKWTRANWVEGLGVSSKLVIGGYIRFTDTYFAPNGVDIRIVGVKTFLSDPYAPVIEISNSVASAATFSSELRKPSANEVKIESRYQDSISFTKRRWRDATELMGMLENALLQNFTSRISPIAIQTMQLLVGDESLQFVFVNSRTAPQQVVNHSETWDNDTKTFSLGYGILKHMTLGISDITGSGTHALSDYKYWDIAGKDFNLAGDGLAEKSYYIYAKCDKNGSMGEFVASETAIALEGVAGYYHFLLGVLNSEYDGDRSYVSLYGFTEILPGRITTDKIVSGQGTTYWDLVQNILNLGGKLQFNTVTSGPDNLLIRGALIQTGSGDLTVIGAWCGEWDGTRIYQLGDEVWKTVNGLTSTYRYVNSVPSSGHDVTDDDYWIVIAEGKSGQSSFKSTVFQRSNTALSAPSGGSYDSPLPSPLNGWSDGVPSGDAQLWMTTRIFTNDGQSPQQNAWTTPQPITDTADIDFEFCAEETLPSSPNTGYDPSHDFSPPNNIWHDAATANDIWMAVRKCSNGVWEAWEITKIKGEDGSPGAAGDSVQVQWSADGTSWHSSYQSGDLYMRQKVGSGSWSSAIRVVGEGGESIYTSFVFKASATQPATPSGTSPIPSGWSDSPPEGQETTLSPTYDSNFVTTGTPHTKAISDNGSVWGKVSFSANAGDIIKVTIRASSEANYDFGYLSPLNDSSQSTSNYVAKVSGTQSTTISFSIPSTGTHFFYVGYVKDGSQSSNDDTIYIDSVKKVTGASLPIWMSSSIVTDGVSDGDWSIPIKITGTDGKGISSAEVRYQGSSSGTTVPSGTWVASPPALQPGQYLWTRTVTYYTDGTYTTAYSVARQGTNGEAGKSPAATFVGDYDSSKAYFGTPTRTDIVYYVNPSTGVGRYYIAKSTAGMGFNVVPTNTAYWDDFGATFDSIATGFAFIQNLVVQRLNTAGDGAGTRRVVAEGNELVLYDDNNVVKLRITGDELSGFPQSTSATFPAYNYGVGESGYWNGGGQFSEESTGVTFTTQAGASLSLPALPVTCEAGFTQTYSGDQMGFVVMSFGWIVDGVRMAAKQVYGYFGRVGSTINASFYLQTSLNPIVMSLGAGSHTVQIYCDASIGGCEDASGLAWNMYLYNPNQASLPISYPVQKTEIGTNGFQVAFGSDRMLKCVISGTSTTFLMQSNNAGIEISSSGTGTGTLRIRIGGTWYNATRNSSGYLVLNT